MKHLVLGIVAAAAISIFNVKASEAYTEIYNKLPLSESEFSSLQSKFDLKSSEQIMMIELLSSYNSLHKRRMSCRAVDNTITAKQMDALNIDKKHYVTVLFYVDSLNKSRCELAEYEHFLRSLAVNLVVQKDPKSIGLINSMNILSSRLYGDFREFKAEFNLLPEQVREAALNADYLKKNFRLFDTLDDVAE
ncbi:MULTISPECIES: hypothetical protein [Pseudoalteromonas]|uniref:DUF4476 domain-containing protein n=1 Tax=Pseudoalteromonas maricaloris TaxID=184924 RepID=A0A8I2KKQ7_9GAMM|nr:MULTISPECIES: hypothetical protein [Pseudoalteromonas]NLR20764.1 hypothetical protein [Pseudoalteromonas maricaloris]ODB34062.1 hypothetical protein BB427_20255 [Pseudoalteromonas sp. BMB]UDM62324.1 hypothetical protein KIJ96_03405 [Pseudoalteromonas piscicida]WOX29753.1 hypothetical protein R5H13_05680 [Pseudoalteromonas maricaloris]